MSWVTLENVPPAKCVRPASTNGVEQKQKMLSSQNVVDVKTIKTLELFNGVNCGFEV